MILYGENFFGSRASIDRENKNRGCFIMLKVLGIDIGSLTIKAVIYDPSTSGVEEFPAFNHKRQPVQQALNLIERVLSEQKIQNIAVTGNTGEKLAKALNAHYVNPALASAEANMRLYPHLRTILTIGASSSNLILISEDRNGKPKLDDILLPPHCSAGTGSFLDKSASRFGITIEEFGKLALRGKNRENISGTCAVFAGSDMIDKQQKGASREDIAAGLHYALARHLLGTLGRGKKLESPFSFQGGVTENGGMVRALKDILSLSGDHVEVLIPLHHRSMSAIGAAILANESRFGTDYSVQKARLQEEELSSFSDVVLPPLRLNDRITIMRRTVDAVPASDGKIPVYIGVDVGSVSTNAAVLHYGPNAGSDRDWELLAKRYLPTQSNPIGAVTQALKEIHEELSDRVDVVDVCVTGSGRKLIADYLGGVFDVNEITAHKVGSQTIAEREGISIDEIFEIGGQDSKYVQISDGKILRFDMNKSCAAGTGSFIEEQTKQLGIEIQDFASLAMRAKSPVSFGNKKCTVFIEEEIAARQLYRPVEDLLGSVAYAVAENYLNHFKIGDKTGRTIFFQGGVALNEAVVAALQYLTNADIFVPRDNEVMGAIGAAIVARRKHSGKSAFIGLENLKKRHCTIETFQCEDCANLCNVSKITANDGVILYAGDRCEKRSLSSGRKDMKEQTVPDLFQERDQLLRADYRRSGKQGDSGGQKLTIGIPRLFTQYYDYFPLWNTFFEELGVKVVISGRTNKTIVAKGIQHLVAETCFPAEITYGHLEDLLDKNVDYIFFPSVIDAFQTKWNERKTFYCTLSQNMPYAASGSFRELSGLADRMLCPAIRLHKSEYNLEDEMIKIAKKLGKTSKEAKVALAAGLRALFQFNQKLRERGKEIFENLAQNDIPIVIVSRSYTLGDPGINVDLPTMILKAGGFPIPLDYLPLDEADIADVQDDANWKHYHSVMRAAEIVRQNPSLNSIYFSVFSCGPDAFLEEFYRTALGGKPFLAIEVGKTTAPALIQTRVEALVNSIKERKNLRREYKKANLVIHTTSKRRILYVPYMDDDVPVFIEVLKTLGVEARALPISTPHSLAIANRYIPEKTCLPARMTAGDYLHFLINTDENPGEIAFFNHQADGACRQKVYSLLQEVVIRELSYDSIPVITPTPGKSAGYISKLGLINEGKNIGENDIARFFARFWQGITANEAIRQLVLSRRPYEVVKGSMDEAYKEGLREYCKTVANGNIRRGAIELFERIMQVPINEEQGKVNIGIVGEGYVRVHEPSNHYAIRHLEELGAVTVLPMAGSFLNYSMENATRKNLRVLLKSAKDFSHHLFLKTIKGFQQYLEHHVTKHVRPFLLFPEPCARKIIYEASKFMDPRASSEAVEGIGMASLYSRSQRIHGILNLIPAHCMAGSALQCYLEKVHRISGIPVLTIPLDGIYDKGFKATLEVLVHKARLFKAART